MKQLFKKVFALLLTLCIIICTLISCGKEDEENTLTKVRLNEVAHSIFYAPMYVAIEEGYFEDEGLEIELTNGAGADNVMTSLLSGNSDIGFMGSEASIYVYLEGSTDYAVNFAGLTQRAGNFLVGRTNSPDFKWSDLIGKTVIAGRAGGMPQMVFEYILKLNDIALDKIDMIQNIDFGNTAAAFISGTGDYTVEFEPFATSIETQESGMVIASLGKDSGYVPYTAFCAKSSYIEDNPDIIQSFTNAIQKGLDYVATHTSEEIAKIIQPQFTTTALVDLTTIVDRYLQQDTWKKDTIFTEDSFKLLQDILISAEVTLEYAPYESLVTTTFSKKALESQSTK